MVCGGDFGKARKNDINVKNKGRLTEISGNEIEDGVEMEENHPMIIEGEDMGVQLLQVLILVVQFRWGQC